MWFGKAADHGNAAAEAYLGAMYRNGLGVAQDDVQAYKWYNLAAMHFPESATSSRDGAIMNREAIAARMTAAQIADAQKLAQEWKPK